jgi:hypothetical protein
LKLGRSGGIGDDRNPLRARKRGLKRGLGEGHDARVRSVESMVESVIGLVVGSVAGSVARSVVESLHQGFLKSREFLIFFSWSKSNSNAGIFSGVALVWDVGIWPAVGLAVGLAAGSVVRSAVGSLHWDILESQEFLICFS